MNRCAPPNRRLGRRSPSVFAQRARPTCSENGAVSIGKPQSDWPVCVASCGRSGPSAGRWPAKAKCPGSTTGFSSRTSSRPAASISWSAILPGFAPKRCRRTPAGGWPADTAGGAEVPQAAGTPIARISRWRFWSVRSSWPDRGARSRCWCRPRSPPRAMGRRRAMTWRRRTTMVTVADLTGSPLASFGATVYPLAVVIRKAAPPARHRVRTGLGASSTVPQAGLRGGGPWLLGHPSLREALAAVRARHPRLDAAVACHLGVKTGANRIFLDPPDVERELLRWAIRGRDVRPFIPRLRTRLLWTHTVQGSPLPRLPPLAAAYLDAAPEPAAIARRLCRWSAVDGVSRCRPRRRGIGWSGPISRGSCERRRSRVWTTPSRSTAATWR